MTYPVLAIEEVISFVKKHAMHGIDIPGLENTSKNSFSHRMYSSSRSGSGPKTSSISRSGSTSSKKDSLARHTEKWSVPLTAVREAVINACSTCRLCTTGSSNSTFIL